MQTGVQRKVRLQFEIEVCGFREIGSSNWFKSEVPNSLIAGITSLRWGGMREFRNLEC
jgi:hypothetical protein